MAPTPSDNTGNNLPGNNTDAGLLGYSAVVDRLEAGEIFQEGTWDIDQVQGAGYDLRMASDLLFITLADGTPVKYEVGQHRDSPVVLEPSCVALVSTHERFLFPDDIGAHVSVKWTLARLGLLVMTGGFVNPRFGYSKTASGWTPIPDERLHFLIANLSGEPQILVPGVTSVASLQFATILGESGSRPAPSSQRLIASGYRADAPLRALSLFPQLEQSRRSFDKLAERVGRIEHGTAPLVTFGVYLVSVTFLGVVLNSLLSLSSTEQVSKLARAVPDHWPFALVATATFLFATVLCKKVVDLLIAGVQAFVAWRISKR